jgi:hypothetical protein
VNHRESRSDSGPTRQVRGWPAFTSAALAAKGLAASTGRAARTTADYGRQTVDVSERHPHAIARRFGHCRPCPHHASFRTTLSRSHPMHLRCERFAFWNHVSADI